MRIGSSMSERLKRALSLVYEKPLKTLRWGKQKWSGRLGRNTPIVDPIGHIPLPGGTFNL